jgi:DnaJ-domain-containing protein 1
VGGLNREKFVKNESPFHRGPCSSSTRLAHLKTSQHTIQRLKLLPCRRFFSSRKRDYYDILGVTKGADKKDIKKQYFQLAKRYEEIHRWGRYTDGGGTEMGI